MPFCDAVVWFLTSTRSELLPTETPSMVCAPDSVMFAVVATRQGALMAMAVSPTTVPRMSRVAMKCVSLLQIMGCSALRSIERVVQRQDQVFRRMRGHTNSHGRFRRAH